MSCSLSRAPVGAWRRRLSDPGRSGQIPRMPEPTVLELPLPDAQARRRISEDLDTNLLVEAGAGSGKTTALVGRMVALVEGGAAEVEAIAAVTFTRKAAAELRERFQMALEERLVALSLEGEGGEGAERVAAALENIHRAFIGTIHAFCARLLREHPLEVGLDPGFQELAVEERLPFRRNFWDAFLERLVRDEDPALEALAQAGLRPGQLYDLFDTVVENPDVAFPADEVASPAPEDVAAVRSALDELVSAGMELMPEREPEPEWDPVQRKIRKLAFLREVTDWAEPAHLFDALAEICKDGPRGHKVTQKRWRSREWARSFQDRLNDFAVGDTPAHRLLLRWYAHRYALAIRLVRRAAEEFAEHRRRSGKLDFQDLLLLTARLLRQDPGARRALGRRYRRLLVDEFQDTDPLQAEIMLLLSSDPDAEGDAERDGEGDEEGDADAEGLGAATAAEGAATAAEGDAEPDWRTVTPRPGALFVVGDPKQSIYRFRRADIQLYDLVKRRFSDFGAVLTLTANFRSRPPIGDLVNQVFDDPSFFPARATPEQAGFEPLNTRPPEATVPREGVFWYAVQPPSGTSRDAVSADDAERLATWIRRRVDTGERKPGDFMVLTRDTFYLANYARALEARGLPVEVTGAGVGVEDELRELLVLLACLLDPEDPVKVVSALVGLFFGLDFEALLTHRLEGGQFRVMRPPQGGTGPVRHALATLHAWWRRSIDLPADVFVGSLVQELGLLPLAASRELGSIRAGAFRFALEVVRAASLSGDSSLPGVLAALESALALKEAEAPLEPGREDVIRLMNLHQAKGLEAPVVVLADPSKRWGRGGSDAHVVRDDTGGATGYLCVRQAARYGRGTLLARPDGWADKERAEDAFQAAEEVRLLYVAVTRAREELVVARYPAKSEGAWAPLDDWLDAHGTPLDLQAESAPPREEVEVAPAEVEARVAEARSAVDAAGRPTFRHRSVTEMAKGEAAGADEAQRDPGPTRDNGRRAHGGLSRGYAWGSVVHGALAAAAGEEAEGALRGVCRTLLVEQGRPLDDHGEPVELEELLALVRTVRASELWQRALASKRRLVEAPFAVTVDGDAMNGVPAAEEEAAPSVPEGRSGRRQLDLFGGDAEPEPAAPEEDSPAGGLGETTVLEGVIDLAFEEDDGWVVADYKTDVGTDPDFPLREAAYRRQVDLYADAWARLTGKPVKERVLFYTTLGRVETW